MTVPDHGNGDLEPEAVAKASALRTLERLNRGKRQVPPMPGLVSA